MRFDPSGPPHSTSDTSSSEVPSTAESNRYIHLRVVGRAVPFAQAKQHGAPSKPLIERDVVFEAGDQAHHRRKHELTEGVVDSFESIERRIAVRRNAFGGIRDRRGVHAVEVETDLSPPITGLVQRHVAERKDRLDIIGFRAGARGRPLRHSREPVLHQARSRRRYTPKTVSSEDRQATN